MTKDEAMQMALYALITAELDGNCEYGATNALRTALAQPEQDLRRKRRLEKVQDAICANLMAVNSNSVEFQPIKTQPEPEPVAWFDKKLNGIKWKDNILISDLYDRQPLYLAPPQRKPLTDDRISEILNTWINADGTIASLCRSIEAAHGIKD